MSDTVFRLEIRGRVQGVGYRWSMSEEARRLGIRGWVRIRNDGSVEAIVAGPQREVDRLIAWARKGPNAALVESVEAFEAEGSFETIETFEQRPTA